MKLLRYGEAGSERPGMLDAKGRVRDLSPVVDDIAGDALLPSGLKVLAELDINELPLVDGAPRIGPCVGRVGKLVGIGLNYVDHAREAGLAVPEEPIVFMKATSSISGPFDRIPCPPGAQRLDWEVELGVVIGKAARHVGIEEALDHVAGYCVVNDVSERAYQFERGGQWVKGKSYDGFGPIGPWLVTRDEVHDPQRLRLWLEVDGHRYQDGSTATMIFGVPALVSHLSAFMTLHTGDVIATGTPPGVGMGQKPEPVYLKPGQAVRLGVEGLGEQHQTVVAATSP